MDRVKLHYMKEQLLHQVLQRLAATYSTLNRRLLAWQQLYIV